MEEKEALSSVKVEIEEETVNAAKKENDKAEPEKNARLITHNSTPSNEYEKAYQNDDFEGFERLLSRGYLKQIKSDLIQSTSELSFLEKILSSHESHAPKYISFVLRHFELWNNEEFLKARNQQGKTPIFYAAQSRNVGNLLSFLMYDWYKPEANIYKTYRLALKLTEFHDDTGGDLLSKLYEIIDDESAMAYKDVCLRMVYQYFLEMIMDHKNEQERKEKVYNNLNEFGSIKSVFLIQNSECREQILELIMMLWLKTDENSDDYFQNKAEILSLEMSEESQKYFELAFTLKETMNTRFEKEFEEFVKKSIKTYGDYHEVIIKYRGRFLSQIARRQDMQKTAESVHMRCPFIELNLPIIAKFYAVQDFRVFNIYPFANKELNKMKKSLEEKFELEAIGKFLSNIVVTEANQSELKAFMFGRNLQDGKCGLSFLEKILMTPKATDVIKLVWEKFELYQKEEFLIVKNPQGKFLLNYAIESKDDENLLIFLMPIHPAAPKFTKNKYFLKMYDGLFKKITGKSLFEHHLKVCVSPNVDRYFAEKECFSFTFFATVFTLLEEIGTITDIRESIPIDELLKLAKNEFFFADLLNAPIDSFDAETVIKLQGKRYNLDDLLADIVMYWNTDDENYDFYKNQLMDVSPIFPMAFDILDGNESHFVENFYESLEKLEASIRERYHHKDCVIEEYTSAFLLLFVITAMKHDRKDIINRILDHEDFSTVTMAFPKNMLCNKTSLYVASKMLERGYCLGRNELPSDWISEEVLKKFLDSRIAYNGKNLFEIDCSFLLNEHLRKYQVKGKKEVIDYLIFNEDLDNLQYIVESESLQSSITHPVLSSYIELKTLKHQGIYMLNFWIFFLVFIVPFGSLIGLHFLSESDHKLAGVAYMITKVFCPFSVLYVALREAFQLFSTNGSYKRYFTQGSNWLEIFLIIFSTMTLIMFWVDDVSWVNKNFKPIPITTILLMTITLLYTLPFSSMPLHMMMLRKVAVTFLKFFITFIFILIAFSMCFCVIFGVGANVGQKNESSSESSTTEPKLDGFEEEQIEEDLSKNFRTFPSAFIKVILMLSGEYSVEPSDLNQVYHMLFFFFFVLSTFILFNLILGLTIDDVQKLRADARYLMLKTNAEKFIETSKGFKDLFDKKASMEKKWYGRIVTFIFKFIKYFIARYPYIQKLDKVYVNIASKEITMKINRKHIKVVPMKMDRETFEAISEVMHERNKE